jgi:hypothetical protein
MGEDDGEDVAGRSTGEARACASVDPRVGLAHRSFSIARRLPSSPGAGMSETETGL